MAFRNSGDGYHIAKLRRDGKERSISIHKLVYLHFVGYLPKGLEIDHIDGNRINNIPCNLEAVTHKENIIRAVKRGSYSNNPKRSGESHGRATVNDIQVLAIRTMPRIKSGRNKSTGWTAQRIANNYNVGVHVVALIRNNKTWRHLPNV